MYTHVRLINHGLNYMKYMKGETSYKDRPDLITVIGINADDPLRSTNSLYYQMRMDSLRASPELVDTTIQMTLSPFKEDSVHFSGAVWSNLWRRFLQEMDQVDSVIATDKDGIRRSIPVKRTNLLDSNQLVCLHLDARSEVPHLHAAICPVDRQGRTYSLDYLKERARKAAAAVESKLGLTDPDSAKGNTPSRAYHTCLDSILEMPLWSWDKFKKGLTQRGYRVIENRNQRGEILNWAMERNGKQFWDDKLGTNLRFINLYSLWRNLAAPYNNPYKHLTLKEVIQQIELRGLYDRFLLGDIRDDDEALLYDIFRQKLDMEGESEETDNVSTEEVANHKFDNDSSEKYEQDINRAPDLYSGEGMDEEEDEVIEENIESSVEEDFVKEVEEDDTEIKSSESCSIDVRKQLVSSFGYEPVDDSTSDTDPNHSDHSTYDHDQVDDADPQMALPPTYATGHVRPFSMTRFKNPRKRQSTEFTASLKPSGKVEEIRVDSVERASDNTEPLNQSTWRFKR